MKKKLSDLMSEEAKKAGDLFITRINNKVLQKRVLSNTAEEYSLVTALESLRTFSSSKDLNAAIQHAYDKKS